MNNQDHKTIWPGDEVIRTLLDDDSAVVRNSLLQLFLNFPEKGREFLAKTSSESKELFLSMLKKFREN